MKNTCIFVAILLLQQFAFAQNTDSLINALEYKMAKRAFYDKQKENRISDLKSKALRTNDIAVKYAIFKDIVTEYQFYSFDKALEYIELNLSTAQALDNRFFINETELSLALLLGNTGRYKECIDALTKINRNFLPASLVNDYYLAYTEGYSGLAYNTTVKNSKTLYSSLYNAYQDSLYARLDPTAANLLRVKEKELRDSGQLDKALAINSKRLEDYKSGSRGFSLVTFERSLLYEMKQEQESQKKYLILSAISDIEASVKDNASMATLARIMFANGDIDRAHAFINFSFDDAEFFNSQLRFVNIANSLPMITKAYEERSETQRVKLKGFLLFSSFLAAFLLVAIYLVFKQVRKVSVARNKLTMANDQLQEFNEKLNNSNKDLKRLYQELSAVDKVKEHYIGTFLNLYSEYITKLDVYRKLVRKYANANQINALVELSKSKQFMDEELAIFNTNFDNSFLHIHPDFVKNVNQLLQNDAQIVLEENHKLNTELRILALIKLGITSSSRIAQILRYSVNTIYNYRAAIKNAAIDKSHFEDAIKDLN